MVGCGRNNRPAREVVNLQKHRAHLPFISPVSWMSPRSFPTTSNSSKKGRTASCERGSNTRRSREVTFSRKSCLSTFIRFVSNDKERNAESLRDSLGEGRLPVAGRSHK